MKIVNNINMVLRGWHYEHMKILGVEKKNRPTTSFLHLSLSGFYVVVVITNKAPPGA